MPSPAASPLPRCARAPRALSTRALLDAGLSLQALSLLALAHAPHAPSLRPLLPAPRAAWAQEARAEERIAVLPLRNAAQLERGEVDYLTGILRGVTAKRLPKTYIVMTQENILTLLPPSTKLEDCVGECEVDTGRTLGARHIITGEVVRFGSSLRLTLRLHDTESGRLVGSEVAKGKLVEDLEAPTEEAIAALLTPLAAPEGRPAERAAPQPAPELTPAPPAAAP
ncbi:MAG: hypothetical protein FJ138_12885, partial [Deltaproteobacteria bacterium]|nr:hypothetical protein [Deltaproteobacteria bacterium]